VRNSNGKPLRADQLKPGDVIMNSEVPGSPPYVGVVKRRKTHSEDRYPGWWMLGGQGSGFADFVLDGDHNYVCIGTLRQDAIDILDQLPTWRQA
jgi:hypothetical protein